MKNLILAICFCAVSLGLAYPRSSRADAAAQELLVKVKAATEGANTITADVQQIDQSDKSVEGSLRLMKPGFAAISYRNVRKGAAPAYVVADGKTLCRYPDSAKNEYLVEVADPRGKGVIDWLGGVPIQSFFGLESALKNGGIDPSKLTYHGKQQWEGASYEVVRHDFEEEGKRYTAWLYVGADHLIHRQVGTYYIPKPNGEPRTFEVDLRNIRTNLPMKADEFAYAPPTDARRLISKVLLPNGSVGPDFAMESKDGSASRLSDFRGKVVVLDFWATWCLPCLREMGETNRVAAKFRSKGVVVLAVNVWDGKPSYEAWLPAHSQFDALVFARDPAPQGKDAASLLYNITGIPTQYVIGKDGKVSASIFGYSGPSDDLEKAIEAALEAP